MTLAGVSGAPVLVRDDGVSCQLWSGCRVPAGRSGLLASFSIRIGPNLS